MKYLLSLIFALALSVGLYAQCPTGQISLESQQDIINFANNFPNCTDLPGSLIIAPPFFSNTTDITDLSLLSGLQSIGGNLFIQPISGLTSLDGLGSLASVGESFQVGFNSNLTSLDALGNLASVGDDFIIIANNSLTSLDGLGSLASVGGYFIINANNSLTSLDALGSLASVEGNIEIRNNSDLTNLDGLSNLVSVGGYFEIGNNIVLSACSSSYICNNIGNMIFFLYDNATGCNSKTEIVDNCPALEAICKNATITIGENGQAMLDASLIDDNSTTDGAATFSVSSSTFDCDELGPNTVTLTVTEGSNSDNCTAIVTVEDGQGLPGGWDGTDIGSTTMGNDYNFEACNAMASTQFSISGSGNNTSSSMTDNVAFASQTLCGDFTMTVKVESVSSNGYGGLMVRENSDAAAKQSSLFSNLTNVLRHEVRYAANGAKQIFSFFKPSPIWLRMQRQGSWIFYYYSTTGTNFQYVHAVSLPMVDCVQVGMASFTYLPNQQATATFSNVEVVGTPSINASLPNTPVIADRQKTPALYPNPTNHEVNLVFDEPIESGTTVVLRNPLGQLVALRELRTEDQFTTWDVSDLTNGLYYIEIRSKGKEVQVLRFVKAQ